MGKRLEVKQEIITDEQIIDLYWYREENAIKETNNKYGKYLFRIAYNILHDRCDSEECQNDTYLGVWNAIPPTKPVVFPAFITQIMRHNAINRYKKNSVKKRIPSELTISIENLYETLHNGDCANEQYSANEIGIVINEYLRGLSEKQRYIFVGRFYMAESVESISKEFGITASAIYKEIEKIKQGLKNHLENKGVYV